MMSSQRELFLIPCCARKRVGGDKSVPTNDPLRNLVSDTAYSDMLAARRLALSRINECTKCLSGKYEKNRHVVPGSDFGDCTLPGQYLPAIDRYKRGTLYASVPAGPATGGESLWDKQDHRTLILSALYGPLHPLSYIQDYNLQMSDKLAYEVWESAFPGFLQNYVTSNHIRSIHLFFGSSTRYLDVAKLAVKPLLESGAIAKAVQYHVIDGNSVLTPRTHGELFTQFLGSETNRQLPDNVEARPV